MLNERFIELLSKKLSSELSAEELAEFNRFIAEDESCRTQYDFFKDYWQQKDEQYANSELMLSRIKQRINVADESFQIHAAPRKTYRLFIRSAAAVSLACLTMFGAYKWIKRGQQSTNTLAELQKTSTKPKTHSIITLTDGTKVTLNAESTLKYPASFDGSTREVYLIGEAYFDVHKDHQHPFIIHTQKMNVKVLGTAFNVKAYPQDATTETTLIRGAIEVTLADRPSDRIILKPNEKLILKNHTDVRHKDVHKITAGENNETQYTLTTLTHYKANDTSVIETAWLKNKLVFRNEDFSTLAERMQRWYGVNIIFENEELKQYRFNGVFENETIDQALFALKLTESFHYKIQNSNVYIY
ncbi:FecR family protein [Mucilaginibacter sp. BJC16-A38]|uniref:FecR family protein n=1 Tax=Mucilaginibacter phenanthrenivorans TaxID=1234842 RepID=UPI0021589258|nr:FecR family protein [Mucilaginibacter phenanthrenivorans]MCR8560103.1 FecR family protein [Mucilaginibacter phenanthrenivorans]